MSTFIYQVHIEPSNSNNHEHITRVRWNQQASNNQGESTTQEMVRFILGGNEVFVKDSTGQVKVFVVNTNPQHLRTYADGKPTNNLLNLPRF